MNTPEITTAIAPFIEAINDDQKESVMQSLARTISGNLTPDQIAEHAQELEALCINLDIENISFDTNCAVINSTENPHTDIDFTSDPHLLSLYSKASSKQAMGSKEQADEIAQAIADSENPSLLVAALKTPFLKAPYANAFAKKLAETGSPQDLYRAFASIQKNTPRSRVIAEALARLKDAAMILEALNNADVESGSQESLILTRGLCATKRYDLIVQAYANYDCGEPESLLMCEALASSGDIKLIQSVIGDTSGNEELTILSCGLQAAAVYTQIKKLLQIEGTPSLTC